MYLSKSLFLPPADLELIYLSVCSLVIDSLFAGFHRAFGGYSCRRQKQPKVHLPASGQSGTIQLTYQSQ